MGEVDEAEAALAQHPLDAIATDFVGMLGVRILDGRGFGGVRLVRSCPFGVVYGKSRSEVWIRGKCRKESVYP